MISNMYTGTAKSTNNFRFYIHKKDAVVSSSVWKL